MCENTKSKKLVVANKTLFAITIIYIFFDIYSNGISDIWDSLYVIGFAIWAICRMHYKDKENLGNKIFLLFTIITIIATIIQFVDIIRYYYYIKISVIIILFILSILQKVILAITIFFNIRKNEKKAIGYILLILTLMLCIWRFFQKISFEYIWININNIYMAVYLIFASTKLNVNKKAVFIIIILFVLVSGIVISIKSLEEEYTFKYEISNKSDKEKYENAKNQLMKIDYVDSSNIPIKKKTFEYNGAKINYKANKRFKQIREHYYYLDGISIFIDITMKNNGNNKINSKELKKFKVDDKEFIIGKSSSYDAIASFTKMSDGSYCVIWISFDKEIQLTEEMLQNIKPFFEMTI